MSNSALDGKHTNKHTMCSCYQRNARCEGARQTPLPSGLTRPEYAGARLHHRLRRQRLATTEMYLRDHLSHRDSTNRQITDLLSPTLKTADISINNPGICAATHREYRLRGILPRRARPSLAPLHLRLRPRRYQQDRGPPRHRSSR